MKDEKKLLWFVVGLLFILCVVCCFMVLGLSYLGFGPWLKGSEPAAAVITVKEEPTMDPRIGQIETQVAILTKPTEIVEEEQSKTEPKNIQSGDWKITYFEGATSEMRNWEFPNLAPDIWAVFPNVDNGQYLASQGLEYGEDLTTFCQYNETCDFVVPARHFRGYSGDYKFKGVGECLGEGQKGCALGVFNVGEVSASFEDQWFDSGFTVWGRYWDGNFLSQAIWALLSHMSNNMLNMDSTLNPSVVTNAGANCSIVPGCESVENTFVITSGNQILMIGRQTITK